MKLNRSITLLCSLVALTPAVAALRSDEPAPIIKSIDGDTIIFENRRAVRTSGKTRVEKKGYDFTLADLRPGWAVVPQIDTTTTSWEVPVARKLVVKAIPLVAQFPDYRGVRDTVAVARAELGFMPVVEALDGVDVQQATETLLASVLKQSGRFIVVDLASRDEVLNEQDFGRSGYAQPGAAAPGGRLIPARFLAKAAIVDFDLATRSGTGVGAFGVNVAKNKARSKLVMELRLVDTETGAIVDVARTSKSFGADALQFRVNLAQTAGSLVPFAGGGDVRDLEKLASAGIQVARNGFVQSPVGELFSLAINELVELLLESTADRPWESIVVQVQDPHRVLIRGGMDVGLKTGTVFDVLKAGPGLTDPETGEILERTTKRTGVIEVVEVRDRISLAKILEGAGVSRGDRCRMKGDLP